MITRDMEPVRKIIRARVKWCNIVFSAELIFDAFCGCNSENCHQDIFVCLLFLIFIWLLLDSLLDIFTSDSFGFFLFKARTKWEPNVIFFFWNDSSQTGDTRSEMKRQNFTFPPTRSKIVQSYFNKKWTFVDLTPVKIHTYVQPWWMMLLYKTGRANAASGTAACP